VRWTWGTRAAGAGWRIGLRRTDWVRVVVDGDGARAEAVGVRRRGPVAVPVSLRLASELAGAGVPLVVRRADALTAPAVAGPVGS
jgi:hypothetical protein